MRNLFILLFIIFIATVAYAANTPPAGSDGDIQYNDNGRYGPYKIGSGLVRTTSGGNVYLNATATGGGGVPGGVQPQLQYNAGVTFGGLSTDTEASYAAHNTIMNGLSYDPRDPAYGALCAGYNIFVSDGHTQTYNYTIPFTGTNSTDNSNFFVFYEDTSGFDTAVILTTADFSVTGVNSGSGTITVNSPPANGHLIIVVHDDSAGFVAASSAAVASGGYISVPDGCTIYGSQATGTILADGAQLIGQNFTPNYNFQGDGVRPFMNVISPSGFPPATGFNVAGKAQQFFEGFVISSSVSGYSNLGFLKVPVLIGGNGSIAGAGQLPGITAQYMTFNYGSVGFGSPIGGHSSYIFSTLRFNNFVANNVGVYGPLSDQQIIGNDFTSNGAFGSLGSSGGMVIGPQQNAPGSSGAARVDYNRFEFNREGVIIQSGGLTSFTDNQFDSNFACGLDLRGFWETLNVTGGWFRGNANGGQPYLGNTTAGQDAHICFNSSSANSGGLHVSNVQFITNYSEGSTAPFGSPNATTPAYALDWVTTGSWNDNVEFNGGDMQFGSNRNVNAAVTDTMIFRNGRPSNLKMDIHGQAVQGTIANGKNSGEARGLPSNQWTGLNIFGDATSFNQQIIPTSNGWGAQVSKQMGIGPTYNIVNDFSHYDCDIVNLKIATLAPPNSTSNPINAWLPSLLDPTYGAGFYQGHLTDTNSCHLGGLTWLTVPNPNRVYAQSSNCTPTGSWSNSSSYGGTYGLVSNTNGDSLACTVTSNGGPIFLWYQMNGNNGGTFTYNLDGGTNTTVATQGQNSFTFPIDNTKFTLGAVRIPSAASGSHTINVAITSTTSTSNTVTIEGFGTSPGKPVSSKVPVAVIGGQLPDASFPSVADAFNSAIFTQALQLQADGLQVIFADPRLYFNAATDITVFGIGGSHINSSGQANIAKAYTGVIQPVRNADNSINPLDYGAACNSIFGDVNFTPTNQKMSLTFTNGSNQVTSAAGGGSSFYLFQPGTATPNGGGDVGKKICLFHGTLSNTGPPPCTYISEVDVATNKATIGQTNLATGSTRSFLITGYPANPNDPSTAQDDTAAFQAAAQASILNGGRVFVPNNCAVHNLRVPANTWMFGNNADRYYLQNGNSSASVPPTNTVLNCTMNGYPNDTQVCINISGDDGNGIRTATKFSNFTLRNETFPYMPYGIAGVGIGYSTGGTGPNNQIKTENMSYIGFAVDVGQALSFNLPIGFTSSIADNGDGTGTMTVTSIDTSLLNSKYGRLGQTDPNTLSDYLALGRTVSGLGVVTTTQITSVPFSSSGGGNVGTFTVVPGQTVSSESMTLKVPNTGMALRDESSQYIMSGIGLNGDFTDSEVDDSICTGTFMNNCWYMGPNTFGSGNGANRWTGGRMEEMQGAAVVVDGGGFSSTGVDYQFNGGWNIQTRGSGSWVQVTGGRMYAGGHCYSPTQDKAMILIGGTNPSVDVTGVGISNADFGSGCGGGTTYLFSTATGVSNPQASVTGGNALIQGDTITGLFNWTNGTPTKYKQDTYGWPFTDTSQTILGATTSGNITAGSSSILTIGNSSSGSYIAGTTTSAGNTVYGFNAFRLATTTSGNTSIGFNTLPSLSTGISNTAVGYKSLLGDITGSSNTALGINSGSHVVSGNNNLILGPNVGTTTLVTGSNNILLGTTSATDTASSSTSNAINIANTLQGDSNVKTVWLGGGSLTTTATDGFVSIPSSAGPPTGTPTSHSGFIPVEIDTSNNRLYFYNSGWQQVSPGVASIALSALTSATTGNTIDNTNKAQAWNWSTLGGNTGLSLSGTTTQSGIGLSVTITGTANTSDAGYFSNTATTGYALYSNGPFAINSTYESPNITTANGVFGTTQPINALSSTTTIYTFLASDMTKMVLFNTTSSLDVTTTLAQAGTAGFGYGAAFEVLNLGAGNVVINPDASTMNNAASLTLTGCSSPPICSWAYITSDGSNWEALVK